jgi:hypothetical protein
MLLQCSEARYFEYCTRYRHAINSDVPRVGKKAASGSGGRFMARHVSSIETD